MKSRNPIFLQLAVAVSAALAAQAFAAQPAHRSMGPAPVTAAPQARALGDAQWASQSKRPARRVVELAAPGKAALDKFKTQRSTAGAGERKALEIGLGRKVERSRIELGALPWEAQADGSRAARFVVGSAGAKALRARLALTAAPGADPAAASLRFAGDDGRIFAESGAAFAGAKAGWTPIVAGDSMTIEIQLPKGADPESYRLNVPMLSHLVFDPASDRRGPGKAFDDIGSSGDCEQDVVCRANPTPGFLAASSAVAHIAITGDEGDTAWCTGTLLNNDKSPKRSLFWTAAHCVSDQAEANSFVTYWFFEASACDNDTASPRTVVLSGGSKLLFRNAKRDTALLELKAAPPTGAYYAGWSSYPIDVLGSPAEAIHHPSGDLKKYSLAQVAALATSRYGLAPLTEVHWTGSGVTEGGSSGSGLFTVDAAGNYLLRGGLYGGPSYCGVPEVDKKDYYSQFSTAWPKIAKYFGP
ncbi:trypsin-like serine peptidase [Lysobacter enzymogenes]|uniref:Serine protease n=1 Tax=Lysobacter enzymogenes TaxID=69 RepID=A0A3N2RFC4_LYSEN|nr:serine protease [Lysobacter enzymogenes]ROU06094.1 serine protease [Lysobacter enzymogenes]